ncbi:MAG TPA: DUF2730 domain-containing protein [Persephonella sp.]|uniref:Putative lipoprotein n=1 Tax=Persephonella marina (strain DSM 14350 / EX-H1) TaxID=123214 RepID=C0QSX4_PERMH|nr:MULTISPECIES: DUF2730 family protein [Persephonella]ACO04031.1 putative lipoprotein [Persephonella marina EX-H1]HCB70590.1 DUF2730 domain-containing protein [Persephonella sp.]
MKRFFKVGAVIGISALILTGCATKDYVDEQLAPVKEKVSSLEDRLNSLENQIKSLKDKADLNAKEIEAIKREHADIKAQLERLDRIDEKATDAYNKAVANEQAIRDLEEKLKRQSVNLERVLKKGIRK